MGQSLSVPSKEAAGHFSHKASGSTVRVYWKKVGTDPPVMHHEIQEHGLAADYAVPYSIGYGNVGRSYLIELGGHFFQSPAAYYTARSEWDASPGYESDKVLDFWRSINSDCLSCHVGTIDRTPTQTVLTPISCDRCHGPGENHRQHPLPGTIVNPTKLASRQRDSVCEQCHLEGATTVANPNRNWSDFKPGEALEDIETHYVYRSEDGQQLSVRAVSQAEQLALSACLRGSGGKLWCGSCHDPHGDPANRKLQIRQICAACHPASQLVKMHKPGQSDCAGCHMPSRRATDVSHAAVTNHRIPRRGDSLDSLQAGPILAPWHQPTAPFAQRNLGLALFNTGKEEKSLASLRRAYELLAQLPGTQTDAPVWAAKGYMLLGSGQALAAVDCFKRSVQSNPENAEYWLDLGVAQNAAGNAASAVDAYRKSIQENPYDYRPYKALSDFYRAREPKLSEAVLREFLSLIPQSLLIRLNN